MLLRHNGPMLQSGVYPAAVTPFDAKGRIDMAAVARLLAWFEAHGCEGAVLAGTNGEGPSLSAPEKRDLALQAMPLRGKLDLVLGVATPSLDEATWLCVQAGRAGCSGVLLMAPFYFRDAPLSGIEGWIRAVLDASPLPVVVYNFPQKTGVTLHPELIAALADHLRFAGVKDSSGEIDNLKAYRQAVAEGKCLFMGNETLLWDALQAGWSGSISGAANVLPMWISQIVREFQVGNLESGEAKFRLAVPAIEAMRKQAQPAMNKALLQRLGVLPNADLRLPLAPPDPQAVDQVAEQIQATLGLRFDPRT